MRKNFVATLALFAVSAAPLFAQAGDPTAKVAGTGKLPDGWLSAFASDSAINKDDPKDGHATNALAVKVDATTVAFMANGKTLKTIPKSELTGISTDGQVGLRVNHNLDLHIANLTVTR